MLSIIGVGAISALFGVGVSYLLIKKENNKQIDFFILEGKAKASAIEFEAKKMLQNAKVKIREDELKLEKNFQKRINSIESKELEFLEQKKIFQIQNFLM